MYAALFTAGVEALAIYSTREPASGKVLARQTALAAPAPAPLPAAPELTRGAQEAPKPENGATASSTTEKLNIARRQHRTVR
jgi:hypothetical protein